MKNDLEALVDARFDPSSICQYESPIFVVVMGAVAVGKTDLRREKYGSGYVVVDAAEIFLDLCRGEYHNFPSIFEDEMETVGQAICTRAFSERRNIVCEFVGDDKEIVNLMIEGLKFIGYKIKIEMVTMDYEESLKRNLTRGDDDISSYYTQVFHMKWLAIGANQSRQKTNVE